MGGMDYTESHERQYGGHPLDIVRECSGRGTGDVAYVTRDGQRWEPWWDKSRPTGITLGVVEDGRVRIV